LVAGVIAGYPVVDVKVTLFDGSYHDVDSSELAFKIAASMAFKSAMKKLGQKTHFPALWAPFSNYLVLGFIAVVLDIMWSQGFKESVMMIPIWIVLMFILFFVISLFAQTPKELLKTLVNINSGSENVEGINKVTKIYGEKLETIGFKNEWIKYHYENASLQMLCQTCNLTRTKTKCKI
jgi:hypothetical protein